MRSRSLFLFLLVANATESSPMTTSAAIERYPPQKIVNYPTLGNEDGGSLFLYGDARAQNVALVSPGFPDDHSVFLPFASRLASETDTLVGVTCLPGYDVKNWEDQRRAKPEGYNLDECVTALREAAKALRAESECPSKPKIIGIFHDWAVLFGNMWANRAIEDRADYSPDELVYFDVLPPVHPKMRNDLPAAPNRSIYQTFCGTYYQIVQAISFIAQRYLGSAVGLVVYLLGYLPTVILPIGPLLKIDLDILKISSLNHMLYMCYPYYHFWKTLLSFVLLGNKPGDDLFLPSDLKAVPLLFLFGSEKRAFFHSNQTVKFLQREKREKKSKSNAIAMEGAGHWLYLQKADECFDHVKNFMMNEKS